MIMNERAWLVGYLNWLIRRMGTGYVMCSRKLAKHENELIRSKDGIGVRLRIERRCYIIERGGS